MSLLRSKTITLSNGKEYTIKQLGVLSQLRALKELRRLLKLAGVDMTPVDGKIVFTNETILALFSEDPEATVQVISEISGVPVSEFSNDGENAITFSDILDLFSVIREVNDLSDFLRKLSDLGKPQTQASQ